MNTGLRDQYIKNVQDFIKKRLESLGHKPTEDEKEDIAEALVEYVTEQLLEYKSGNDYKDNEIEEYLSFCKDEINKLHSAL